MNETQTSLALRKAAILISTLDSASAEALLDKMPDETAEVVRLMVVELDDVPAAEQEAVIMEFMSANGTEIENPFAGVELDPSLASKLRSPDGYADSSPEPAASSPPPFEFLRHATAGVLARHLERQHPQVIAVVTAHLPPRQAAEVIKKFPPKLQTDVLRRVAELDLADQEALRDIERELEMLLSDDLRATRNRNSGLATVSTILNAAGAYRKEMLHNLAEHERELATELTGVQPRDPSPRCKSNTTPIQGRTNSTLGVQKRVEPKPKSIHAEDAGRSQDVEPISESSLFSMEVPRKETVTREIEFEELALLSDDDWAILIRATEPNVVLLALTGASEQLLRRITQQLSKREAQVLRTRLQQTGPLRLSDIEHAQRNLATLASRLAARGEITLPERRAFAAAA